MQTTLNRFTASFTRLPDRIRGHRRLGWLLFLLLAAGLTAGIGRMRSDMSMESFFTDDDPFRLAYDRFRADFGSDEALFIVYRARDGDVFSEASLAALSALHREIEDAITRSDNPIDRLTEIRSLVNADFMEAQGDVLYSRDFIGATLPATDEERQELRAKALAHPVYPGLYVSEDARFGGIIVRTDFNARLAVEETQGGSPPGGLDQEADSTSLDDEEPEFDAGARASAADATPVRFARSGMPDYADSVTRVDAILAKPEYTAALELHKVGNPARMAWAYGEMRREMRIVMLGMVLLITATLLFLFRSLAAVVWPLVTVVVSLFATFGMMGWTGMPANNFLQITVFLVLAVGVADTIHILSGYTFFRGRGQDHGEAIRSAYEKSGVACFLTTLTTSIGLLALSFVPVLPVRQFGLSASFGIWMALAITLFVLPLFLDLWSPRSKKAGAMRPRARWVQGLLEQIESLALAIPRISIVTAAAVTVAGLIGARDIVVDSNLVKNLDSDLPIRIAIDLVDERMAGSSNLEILIDTGARNGFKDPAVLQRIEALQDHLESAYPGVVTKTVALTNVVKESYQAIQEGRADSYVIPDDSAVLAQVLFLFEGANAKDRRQLVTDDYRAGRVSVTMKNVSTRQGMDVFRSIEAYIADGVEPLRARYPALATTLTGQLPMSLMVSDYINNAQLQTFGVAFLVILLLLPVVFGSLRLGLIGIVPNVVPAVVVFGVMGYAGIYLDIHTLLIAPIIIGIAVDDTIHFMTHYKLEMATHGDSRRAIANTFREVGQAILFTSIVLSAGFIIFLTSADRGLASFGGLSAVAMGAALACDLFLLPAFLGRARGFREAAGEPAEKGEAA